MGSDFFFGDVGGEIDQVLGQVAGPDHVDLEDIHAGVLSLKELEVQAETVGGEVRGFQHFHRDVRAGFHEAIRRGEGQFQFLADRASSHDNLGFRIGEAVDFTTLGAYRSRQSRHHKNQRQKNSYQLAHLFLSSPKERTDRR